MSRTRNHFKYSIGLTYFVSATRDTSSRSFIRPILRNIIDKISLSREYKLGETVTVFGAPRTGTTWLVELLNANPSYLTIAGPLAKEWFPRADEIGVRPREFLHPDEDNQDLEQYLLEVFNGKIVHGTLHYKLSLSEAFKRMQADKLLIKFNRGNRLLPWISRKFDLIKKYLIVRHPCAALSSQIRGGYTGYIFGEVPETKTIIDEMSQIELINDSQIKKAQGISTTEEKFALIFALDHFVPFKLMDESVSLVCYEDLLLDSNRVLSSIFSELDQMEYLKKALNSLNEPSLTTLDMEMEYLKNKQTQLSKWRERFSPEETARISKVLGWFEIDFNVDTYSIVDREFPKIVV